jgi:tRNA (guanine37-N1)-methyltransferase
LTTSFDVITLMPQMFNALTIDGVISRAFENKLLELNLWNPRDFVDDIHQSVDDRPFGGGPGMVMMIDPILKALDKIKINHQDKDLGSSKVIYLSPKGKRFDHKKALELSNKDNLILICGRYEGIDQRFIDGWVDEEISVGDYVTSGGELPAMILVDAISRLIPGVLNKNDSYIQDSFYDGLLDHSQYTRSEEFKDLKVPDVLLSGDHKKIAMWRLKNSLYETFKKRPDLLKDRELTTEESRLLQEVIREQEHDSKKRK